MMLLLLLIDDFVVVLGELCCCFRYGSWIGSNSEVLCLECVMLSFLVD